jgi:hypothetical protein
LNPKIPVEWALLQPGDDVGGGQRIESDQIRQREAPVVYDAKDTASQWAELKRRNGRECGNCRYFSPATDPTVQKLMTDAHVVEAIEKEAQIKSRLSLPLLQGICHADTKVSALGGKITFTPASEFCENHVPKNRLLSFFGMGGSR